MSDVTDRLDRLYDKLPTIACRGKCQNSCGPIRMSAAELARITKRFGHEPKWHGIGRAIALTILGRQEALTCPLLKDGRCGVYAIRPMICRLFGLVKKMACPFGCEPDRWLTDAEAHRFLDEAVRIGGAIEERGG